MTLATTEPTDLALDDQQTMWTDRQVSALTHIGVENASTGDLEVFFHVCKRTGLDPFARQIYMIGRQASEKDENGNWVRVTKQTIQTGIDGFRLIVRRAADRHRETISVDAPEWAHHDGTWRPVWRQAWGQPVAARVTIRRGGQPFTAVALFEEYVQTKRDGNPTQMWAQRPAGQIAKCAEALAWRTACPQDLSGIYADEEMQQADNQPARREAPADTSTPSRMAAMLAEEPTPEPEPADIMLDPKSALGRKMFATLGDIGITDKADRLAFVTEHVGRPIESSAELTEDEARKVIADAESIAAPAEGGESNA